MTPAKERKAAERQRRKDAGLVRVEVWVKPQLVAHVKAFAKRHMCALETAERAAKILQDAKKRTKP